MTYNIHPEIKTSAEKMLIGKRMKMTFAGNRTAELWRSFMPQRGEIKNNLNSDLISMQLYGPSFDFGPDTEFEKWAAVEVPNLDTIPAEMETIVIPGGLYAVFNYKGLSTDTRIFHYIFATWLPASQYELDDRPHFEVLGAKYKNADPESEEEIWIPIRPRDVRASD